MDAYIYGERLPLPEGFAAYHDRWRSAVVSIDMHQGHLADTPDCPCPAPRARELVAPIDAFHDQARRLGVPIIHVRTILRKRGVDDVNGLKAAWRLVFPLYAGNIPNADEHGIEGTRWTEFVTRVEPEDLTVNTKKRLSAFYPTDLDFLLRNLDVRTVVLNGGFTDCCILNAAFDASNLGYKPGGAARSRARDQSGNGGRGAEDRFAAPRFGPRLGRSPRPLAERRIVHSSRPIEWWPTSGNASRMTADF